MPQYINFTKKIIDNVLWSQTSETYYLDSKVPCHRLVITKAGRKTFYVYMRFNNEPTKRKVGRYPNISPEKARDIARDMISDMVKGIDPYDKKKKLKAERTYEEMWERYYEYLCDKADQKPKTAEANKKKHLSLYRQCAQFHKLKLSEITSEMLAKFHHDYSFKKKKKPMANAIIGQIRANYKHNRISPNPATSIEIRLNKRKKCKRILSSDELKRFMNALQEDSENRFRDVFLICLFTAARIGSVMSMEWSEVDLKNNLWTPVTKTSEDENDATPIGLPRQAVEILKARRKMDVINVKWVFPSCSNVGHYTQPQGAFKRILSRANIENFTPHGMRRTITSLLTKDGASNQFLLSLLGNTSVATLEIYAQNDVNVVRRQVEPIIDAILKDVKIT